ncbi:hypothetical protein [Chryseobacterium sp. 22458]|uniref:hypothetical protein n=1 Tax=Chryseobacterium sp. 22458 TaxID=3453921 RepID=UPI003F86157D
MKKTRLFLGLILPLGLFGQSVVVVPNTENYGQNGIVYNNTLFFSKNKKLARFDGTSVVSLPNPIYNGNAIDGELAGTMIIYNNKLCYNYDYKYETTFPPDILYKDYLITYDGTVENVILNTAAGNTRGIFIDDNGNGNEPVLYNGKMVFRGSSSGILHLFTFDGQTIVKINNHNNINSTHNDLNLGNWAHVHDNVLYFGYHHDGSFWGLGKFDGTNVTKLTNNDYEYHKSIFTLNNILYFKMYFMSVPGSYSIGTYNPLTNVLSKVPGPNMFQSDEDVPLIYNSKAYITSQGFKFAIFDGVTTTEIPNLNINDKGVAGKRILFGNTIYFPYQDSNLNYFLGKFSGTNISLIPNISTSDKGIGKSLTTFNGELYFTYTTASISYLAKSDGQTITVMPNPDNGAGVQDSKFVVYGNDLYFPYKNAAGTIVLAKYGTTVLNTKEEVKNNNNIIVYKDNKGFSVVSKIKEIANVEIMDASGKMISHEKVNNLKYSFELNTTGIFIIKVTLKDGEVFTQKIRS